MVHAQMDTTKLNNLVQLSELYSSNPNATGEEFQKKANTLRTPELNHIIDVLILSGKGDISLLSPVFLNRPDIQELKLWYAIREIHYNNQPETKTKRKAIDVAREVLNKDIDERWLLDNYYYHIRNGVAMLSNTADLSGVNIDLTSYNLKNETEQAILYLNLVDGMTQRFKVLQAFKNNTKILEFSRKLPKFNGKEYYCYLNFGYKDFDWIGYDKHEKYNTRHIGNLYATLLTHYGALAVEENPDVANKLYLQSILYKHEFFKYSEMKSFLNQMYKIVK